MSDFIYMYYLDKEEFTSNMNGMKFQFCTASLA